MSRVGPVRPRRGTDLPTMLASLRGELSTCHDRLLARWSSLVQVEASVSPLQRGAPLGDLAAERWAELAVRVDEDHQLAAKILGQLHWACRVDSGERGTPSLVSETLHDAIGHAASLASCLEAAAHTLRTALPDPRNLGEAASMCRRFLGSAQHDLDKVGAAVAEAVKLVPEPPARWHLRVVI